MEVAGKLVETYTFMLGALPSMAKIQARRIRRIQG
jgi:hypothetical protein